VTLTADTRRALLAALVFVGIAVMFAPDAATGQGVFWHHDLRHHHYPWRVWAAATWASGEVPWWAPGAGNGFPLLAEGEGGFLYPVTMVLFLALPGPLALNASVLVHQALAALGVWCWLRARGSRPIAAYIGAITYAWSGFLVSHTLYLGMQNGAAWIGWALFAATTRRWWLVALSIGMLGLAGHPQLAAFAGLAIGVHGLAVGGWRWALGALGGVVIASPQLVATLELVRFSGRDGGVDALFAQVGKLPIQELVGVAFPYAFGFDRPADVAQTYYHRGLGYWGQGVNHWEMCFYLGIPVLTLAWFGARKARGWAAGVAVATLLMFGGPLWELVRHLPGFDGFRFPARFAVIVTLGAAVLAAEGVEVLRRSRRPERVTYGLRMLAVVFSLTTGSVYGALHVFENGIIDVGEGYFERQAAREAALAALIAGEPAGAAAGAAEGAGATAAAGAAGAAAAAPGLPPPPALSPLARAALPAPEAEDPAKIPAKVARILADLRHSTAPGSPRVLIPVALLLLASFAVRRPWMWALLVVFELWRFGHAYQARVPRAEVEAQPGWLGEGMTEPGGPRLTVLDRRISPTLDTAIGTASLGLLWGTSDVILPSPLLFVRNEALLATAGLDVGDTGRQKVRRYLDNLGLARRMAVRWIATTHTLPPTQSGALPGGLVQVVRGGVNVYVDPSAAPRARVVTCLRGVASVDEAFSLLAELPVDTSVVEGAERCPEESPAIEAELLTYTNQRVELRATGPGTLVLADTWYPRWVATVDDAPAAIERVDVTFRGVALPAGEHTVVFRYTPGPPGMALAASLLALVAVGVAAMRGRGAR
jgi:hypothetical protein